MKKIHFGFIVLMVLIFLISVSAEQARLWVDRINVNGMNIFLQKTNSNLVEMTLLLKSGSGIESRSNKGAALIMNSLVMLKLKYGEAKIGDVEVETYPDYTLIFIKTSSKNAYKALEEIKDLLSYPLYSYDVITDLKGIFNTDLKGLSPIARTYYQFTREFYGENHPYNDRLDPTEIEAISGDDVYRWYRQTYQPGNAILSIYGGMKQNINDLKKFFSNMLSQNIDNRLIIAPVSLEQSNNFEFDEPNSRVTTICIGFPAPRLWDPEYPAFRLLYYYLEDYLHYFDEIRVKEGLIYAGFVYYNYLDKPNAPNIVFLTMTNQDSQSMVETKTFEVINKLLTDGISQEEIDQVVTAIKKQDTVRKKTGKGYALKNALNQFLQTQLVYEENLFPKLEQVKTEDIKQVAAKYFKHFIKVAYIPKMIPDNF